MTIIQSMTYVVTGYMFAFLVVALSQIENRITERKGEK